jgi:hypothetical protein
MLKNLSRANRGKLRKGMMQENYILCFIKNNNLIIIANQQVYINIIALYATEVYL